MNLVSSSVTANLADALFSAGGTAIINDFDDPEAGIIFKEDAQSDMKAVQGFGVSPSDKGAHIAPHESSEKSKTPPLAFSLVPPNVVA